MLRNKIRRTICGSGKKIVPILSIARNKSAYEGEGKTTVRILNQEPDSGLMIDTYATFGFRLNNGITVLGPMAIFPRTVLSWQVQKSDEINERSLKFFKLLQPKIDLLVLGLETKERAQIDCVFRAAKNCLLNVEILPTEHACSTFNFLSSEGRCVAAALIPPLSVTPDEDDMLRSKMHYEDVFHKPMLV